MQPLRSYPCFSKCPYTDSHIHQVDSVSQKTKNKQRKEKKEEHIKLVGKSSGGKKELKGGVWGVDLAKFYAWCINMILRNPSYSFLYLCLFAIVVLLEMLKQFWNHWRNKKTSWRRHLKTVTCWAVKKEFLYGSTLQLLTSVAQVFSGGFLPIVN